MVMEATEEVDLKSNKDDIIAALKKYSALCPGDEDKGGEVPRIALEPCKPDEPAAVDPVTVDPAAGCSSEPKDVVRISQSHSKKVIKHALRQQAKRRRKNTTIASGSSEHVVVKSTGLDAGHVAPGPAPQPSQPRPGMATMREVLASIPGFSMKPRRRSSKKLSTAAQLEQTKEGCVDLETPDSILAGTNLRLLLNKHTFSALPPLYQYKLVQLLPSVDQADMSLRLSSSGLNNEFFARACLEWNERLSEGEFTPENQQRLKAEAEKEMSRLDPWKLKHFEPIWGERHESFSLDSGPGDRPSLKTTIKLPPSAAVGRPAPRLRTVGAVTRAITSCSAPPPRHKRPARDEGGLPAAAAGKKARADECAEPASTSPAAVDDPFASTDVFNDSDHSAYEPTVEHADDVIHESAILHPTLLATARDSPAPNATPASAATEDLPRVPQPGEAADWPASDQRVPPLPDAAEKWTNPEVAERIGETRQAAVWTNQDEDERISAVPEEWSRSAAITAETPVETRRRDEGDAELTKDGGETETEAFDEVDARLAGSGAGETLSDDLTQTETKMEDIKAAQSKLVAFEAAQSKLVALEAEQSRLAVSSPVAEMEDAEKSEQASEGFQTPALSELSVDTDGKIADFEQTQLDEVSQPGETVDDFSQSKAEEEVFSQSNAMLEDFNESNVVPEDFSESNAIADDFNQSNVVAEDFSQSNAMQEDFSQSNVVPEDFNQCVMPEGFTQPNSMPEDFTQSNAMSEDLNLQETRQPLDEMVRSRSHHETVEKESSSPEEAYAEAGCGLVDLSQSIACRDFAEVPADTLRHADDKLENLSESIGKLDNFEQTAERIDDFIQLGQTIDDFGQTRSSLVEFDQKSGKIEDFSHSVVKVEGFGLLSNNSDEFHQAEGEVDDLSQSRGNLEEFNQTEETLQDFSQSQRNLEEFNQSEGKIEDYSQSRSNLEVFNHTGEMQQDFSQSKSSLHEFDQSTVKLEDFNQSRTNLEEFNQSERKLEDFTQPRSNLEDFSHSGSDAGDFNPAQSHVVDFNQLRSSLEEYHQSGGKLEEFGRAGDEVGEYVSGVDMEAALLVAVSREWEAKCSSGEVKVIPMHEELEMRLEEGSYPVGRDLSGMDWYPAAPGGGARGQPTDVAPPDPYSGGQALKLELEVTLTPEASSAGGPSPGPPPASVIPPTTIVCLPSLVVSAPCLATPTAGGRPASSSALPYLALSGATPLRALATQLPKGASAGAGPGKNKLGREPAQGAAPSGRNSRGVSTKPPPGAVNLERSYQICQAVIQNSPNRDQLRAQLKPPPPLLAAPRRPAPGPSHPGLVTTPKGVRPLPPPAAPKPAGAAPGRSAMYDRPLRLPSPPPPMGGGMVRHVFTSAGGIPVTMAVLPQGQMGGGQDGGLIQESLGPGGQYILVQRAGEAGMDMLAGRRNPGPPRASSAPPANRNMGAGGGVRPMGGRGRPASVDVRQEYVCPAPERYLVACPSPGTQAVSRRRDIGHGMSYADVGDAAPPGRPELSAAPRSQPRLVGGVALGGGGFGTQCGGCNARPMVVCRKCGAFCHDDCISAASICGACLVR